jgi:hypothetical protein
MIRLENSIVRVFSQMVMKLNENNFKPLWAKFFDWAVMEESGEWF